MQQKKNSQWALIGKSWAGAFDIIFGANQIIIPFVVIAALELIGIIILFFAIQPPVVKYIAPVVLRFFGEKFLHYPFSLLLLSRLFSYLQIVLTLILGSFASGLTISNVFQYSKIEQFSYKTAFKETLFKYISLLIITVLMFFLVMYVYSIEKKIFIKILMKGSGFLGLRREAWSVLFMIFGFIGVGFVQSLFAFVHAAIMIDNKNFITAIFRNIVFVFKNLFAVLILVIIPLLFYIPIILFKGNMFELMKRTAPEIVFVILFFGVVVTLFINVLITISTTNAYLLIRGKDDV